MLKAGLKPELSVPESSCYPLAVLLPPLTTGPVREGPAGRCVSGLGWGVVVVVGVWRQGERKTANGKCDGQVTRTRGKVFPLPLV